jgi:hypothetical protein
MQAVSDPFLGWVPFGERDYYVHQLRDRKGPGDLALNPTVFEESAALTAGTLARARASSLDPAVIRGYLGKGEAFREATCLQSRESEEAATAGSIPSGVFGVLPFVAAVSRDDARAWYPRPRWMSNSHPTALRP